jgi:hypothetical protein
MLNTFFKVFLVINQLTLTLFAMSINRHLENTDFKVDYYFHEECFEEENKK